MRTFKGGILLAVTDTLQADIGRLYDLKNRLGGGAELKGEALAKYIATLESAKTVSAALGLSETSRQIEFVKINLSGPVNDVSTVLAASKTAHDLLLSTLWDRKFLLVDSERSPDVDNALMLGEAVANAFPDAKPDIRDIGNCLAAECPTAAVFHMMRAVEWGLRALARDLGLLRVVKTRKGGRLKYTPLAYSEWEQILNQLQPKVDEKLASLRPGTKKESMQDFYLPALQDIRGIRDAWRNHVMHARRMYTMPEADAIYDRVERLMQMLASQLSEV